MSDKATANSAPGTDETKPTFRRFQDGQSMWTGWSDLSEKIFQADKSYKCPTYVHRTPPCQGSCPSGHDVRGWLAIARGMDKPTTKDQNWQEYAFQRMVEANPFPATMGRVCPAPCEDGCNRNEVDDFVGINAVEQYVGDWANEKGLKLPPAAAFTGKTVAVIGAGPAGLAAAYFLRRRGHGVAIFDRHDKPGGMMRFGIPGYRTPRDILDKEIQRIIDLGVVLRTNTVVGVDISIADLEKSFDAIFWAIGAQKGRGLPVPGWEGTENCITGVEFLDVFNKGWVESTGKRVVVVGGGDTSIDVASVARRLGHIAHQAQKDSDPHTVLGFTAHDVAGTIRREGMDATLTSLFPIEKMTASEREREDAKREGITILGGVMPLEVLKDDKGRARALKMCKCTMKGMTPIAEPGSEFEIPCDIVVSAIGQMGDFAGIEAMDGGKGFFAIDSTYRVKGKAKHFAGGDAVRPHLLTTAIGHARIAVDCIDTFLAGGAADKRPKVDVHHFNLLAELHQRGLDPAPYDQGQVRGTSAAKFAVHNYEDRGASQIIPHDDLFKGHFKFEARGKRVEKHIGADQVLGNFEERIQGFTEEQAKNEGKRCMSCGLCFECDNCVVFCPQTGPAFSYSRARQVRHPKLAQGLLGIMELLVEPEAGGCETGNVGLLRQLRRDRIAQLVRRTPRQREKRKKASQGFGNVLAARQRPVQHDSGSFLRVLDHSSGCDCGFLFVGCVRPPDPFRNTGLLFMNLTHRLIDDMQWRCRRENAMITRRSARAIVLLSALRWTFLKSACVATLKLYSKSGAKLLLILVVSANSSSVTFGCCAICTRLLITVSASPMT